MGRGSVFSPSDFYDLGSRDAVASTLKRLKQDGTIRHLGRALYDFPKKDDMLGLLEPDLDAVIKALEKRENMTIYPSEAYAAYHLGLTDQVPMNLIFTALHPLSFQCRQRSIRIKKASVKTLAIKERTSMVLTQALKWIGAKNITQEQMEHLCLLIPEDQKDQLLKDIRYMPLNQHTLVRKIAQTSREP